ncbi:hypothetical protein AST02_05230 [Staphylococcus equorum]|nr:hypothetical protein AST02_05230 [Staphylococcus equorum]
MQMREELLSNYENLSVVETQFPVDKVKGYYKRNKYLPNGLVILNNDYDHYIQNGVLAEELGHHETSYGNITGVYSRKDNINAARQELKARRYGFKLAVPLEKLIKCYKQGVWGDLYEMCLLIQIDRSYFFEAIEDYKKQFGNYVKYDGYFIQFEPLKIMKKD